MKCLPALLAAVGLLTCACATSARIQPLELEPAEFAVSYSGQLGPHALDDLPEYALPEKETSVTCALEVRILRGKAADAAALFGQRVNVVGAWSMDAAELSAAKLAAMHIVSAPRLTVFEGQNGMITVANQIAYISGFEVTSSDGARVADPVVQTLLDGLMLGLSAKTADGGQMRLSLDLTMAECVKPIRTQEIDVLGARVTIQTPVIYSQRIQGEGLVGEGRALVLTGMIHGDETYVVLITGRRG
jgi:hypothetical protein